MREANKMDARFREEFLNRIDLATEAEVRQTQVDARAWTAKLVELYGPDADKHFGYATCQLALFMCGNRLADLHNTKLHAKAPVADAKLETLSKSDKEKIYRATRYADVMSERQFTFEVRGNDLRDLHFRKPGTTSDVYFKLPDDMKAREDYVAKLAGFALNRMVKKFSQKASSWLCDEVLLHDNHEKMYAVRISELLKERNFTED